MNRVFVVAGPSGIGKTFLARKLIGTYPDLFVHPMLFTTRRPRSAENFFSDRVHISNAEFKAKQQHGDFMVVEKFDGNLYGYPKQLIQPGRHSIVDTAPDMISNFQSVPGICFVGLSIAAGNISLLKNRLLPRYYSPKAFAKRLALVKKDLGDLERLKALVEQQGKIFTIRGDDTIFEEVIPWLLKMAGVKPKIED